MKILIIGGTRFVGPYVLKKLHASGHTIMVFHRGITNMKLPDGVVELFGDRNQLGNYRQNFKLFQPDVVLDMILLNEKQAHELIKAISGIVNRVIMISSCDVYQDYGLFLGNEDNIPARAKIFEDAPLRQKYYPYRDANSNKDDVLYYYDKIPAEQVVRSNRNISSTILRLPMVYGPGDYQYRFWEYIKRMTDKRPAIIIDDIQARWRITRGYVENCAEAICTAITCRQTGHKLYNVGEPIALEEQEWIAKIAEIIGWPGKIITLPQIKLPNHLKTNYRWQYHLDIDTSQIRKELGFKETVNLNEALKRTIKWELENPSTSVKFDKEYQAENEFLAGFRS